MYIKFSLFKNTGKSYTLHNTVLRAKRIVKWGQKTIACLVLDSNLWLEVYWGTLLLNTLDTI